MCVIDENPVKTTQLKIKQLQRFDNIKTQTVYFVLFTSKQK